MEVILSKDIDRIGKSGHIVKVKDGFARNFLIPNGLAVPVTTANINKLEQDKQQKNLQSEKERREAEELRDKLARLSLTIPVLTHEEDKLYASITAQDVAAALNEEGFNIDKNLIMMDEPIKALGIFEVSVKLLPEIPAKLKVWVVKK